MPGRRQELAPGHLDHAIARLDELGCNRVQVLAAGSRRQEHAFWERSGLKETRATQWHPKPDVLCFLESL